MSTVFILFGRAALPNLAAKPAVRAGHLSLCAAALRLEKNFLKSDAVKAPLIVSRAEIEALLPRIDSVAAMARAFEVYSAGRAAVPSVQEILFPAADGEAHIKSGYVNGDGVFVVKIATGFYRNPAAGLPSSSGTVLVFDAAHGFAEAILLDEGLLTDWRTAAAGALAAKHLAPREVTRIGIVGSGTQARLQAKLLRTITPCRAISLWARDTAKAERCAADLACDGFDVEIAGTCAAVAAAADLIVTTTPAKAPLLSAGDIRAGTHITAVGADTPEKQELDAAILARADVVAVDSLAQGRVRGELHHALKRFPDLKAVELGAIVSGAAGGRTTDDQITVADLTGVAVQDIEIAKAALDALRQDAQ
jgi:ornithine cyclodeaminase